MDIEPSTRAYVLRAILRDPKNVTRRVMDHFTVSRPTALRWIKRLIEEGLVGSTGSTSAREYGLKTLFEFERDYELTERSAEDRIWRADIEPLLSAYRPGPRGIAQHALTEIVNNAIDHAGSPRLRITVTGDACTIHIVVRDWGVGIFEKILDYHDLEDERHAVLELSKGKLTTDPDRHTGEGIFFVSRACSAFSISSGDHVFHRRNRKHDWMFDAAERVEGTEVDMTIDAMSPMTMSRVFDSYAADVDEGFTKTHVPVSLVRYKDEGLVSRSQAKRLLARFERFKEVHLDFRDIDAIGPAFADEIFRVFPAQHPDVAIHWRNATPEIEAMIRRKTGPLRRPDGTKEGEDPGS